MYMPFFHSMKNIIQALVIRGYSIIDIFETALYSTLK